MDEYRENVKKVQKALNQDAAFIQSNPYLAQRVLNAANAKSYGKGGLTVRKKFSMSFVLTLILILFSLTAVAAVVLSGKAFVAQYIAPLSGNTDGDTWSYDELQYIKNVAVENGVPMTDEILSKFETEDLVFKETLMRLFMKMELGDSPASWPVEDQAWYDELLFSYGLVTERTRFVPMEGEITAEDATNAAIKYAQDNWMIDLSDVSSYRKYTQYMLSTDESGEENRVWNIEFEFANGYTYVICIASDGEIIDDPFLTYIHTPEDSVSHHEANSTSSADLTGLAMCMTNDSFYNVYTLASFRENYGEMINLADDRGSSELQLMKQLLNIPYAMPGEKDITPEDALEIAKQKAIDNGWTAEWLEWCKNSVSYRIYTNEQPVYRVCFKLTATNRDVFYQRSMPFGFVVYIDPATGAVSEYVTLNELDDFDRYCEFPDPHDLQVNPGNG